jgi:hypothetical protein
MMMGIGTPSSQSKIPRPMGKTPSDSNLATGWGEYGCPTVALEKR